MTLDQFDSMLGAIGSIHHSVKLALNSIEGMASNLLTLTEKS